MTKRKGDVVEGERVGKGVKEYAGPKAHVAVSGCCGVIRGVC